MRFVLIFLTVGFGFGFVAVPESLDVCTASQAGRLQILVSGDGSDCRKVQLTCKNLTQQPISVELPRYTVMDSPRRQDILLLEEKRMTLPPGGSARATCASMCCGQRSEEPPPRQPETYQPVACGSHPGGQEAANYFQCAQRLSKANAFGQIPILPSQQPAVIAQLAYWASHGQVDKIQLRAQIQQELRPKGQASDKEADLGLENVWSAVEMTRQEVLKK
ncbi:MAG: hypothetical protein U0931_41390 [Vulcanimicrobiota bacterium]